MPCKDCQRRKDDGHEGPCYPCYVSGLEAERDRLKTQLEDMRARKVQATEDCDHYKALLGGPLDEAAVDRAMVAFRDSWPWFQNACKVTPPPEPFEAAIKIYLDAILKS